MAVLAVVTSTPPGVEGGHLVIARAFVEAARRAGHEAALVLTPDHGFGRQTSSYWAAWWTDVRRSAGRPVDQVISLRYPSFAVRHPVHVCWLNHTIREYYDLWPRFAASISRLNRIKEGARKTCLHAVDKWLLTRNVRRVFTISDTVRRRLVEHLAIEADVHWPPPPPLPYRCEGYGDYIFAVSRLTPLKRLDLLLRALAEPPARRIKAVIAGEGDERRSLERLAADLGVADRVRLPGRIDDDALLDHLARCRAVCFTPFSEDYGFVTVEAFASRKGVITCADSGGPAELVCHEHNGLIVDPIPAVLAAALARVMDDSALAERLGENGHIQASRMTWEDTIQRLVIV